MKLSIKRYFEIQFELKSTKIVKQSVFYVHTDENKLFSKISKFAFTKKNASKKK